MLARPARESERILTPMLSAAAGDDSADSGAFEQLSCTVCGEPVCIADSHIPRCLGTFSHQGCDAWPGERDDATKL